MTEKYWGWEVWANNGYELAAFGKAQSEVEAEHQAKEIVKRAKAEGEDASYEVDLYWNNYDDAIQTAIKESIPQMFDERIARWQQTEEEHGGVVPGIVIGELRDLREMVLKATDRL